MYIMWFISHMFIVVLHVIVSGFVVCCAYVCYVHINKYRYSTTVQFPAPALTYCLAELCSSFRPNS